MTDDVMTEVVLMDAEAPAPPAQADIRYVINPHLRIVFISDDEIAVRHSGRSPTSRIIRDEGGTKSVGRILRGLRQPRTLNEVAEAHPGVDRQEVEALVTYLEQESVIIRTGQDVIDVYMSSILRGTQPLADRRVAIIGSGYLGSRIAVQLAQLGVWQLSLMDDRTVIDAGVDARYFALPRDMLAPGAQYVDLVARYVRENSQASVHAVAGSCRDAASLKHLLSDVDCAVFASEHPGESALHAMNEAALELDVPWLAVTLDGSEAVIGPMFIPGESACYNEYALQAEAACYGVKDEFMTYREAMDRGDLGTQHLSLPTYSDIAAGLAATALARFLIGGKAFLLGRAIRYDFERLSVDTEEVLRLPRCPACAPARAYRHSYL